MSDYTQIEMSPELRTVIDMFEAMPEYKIVTSFLERWNLTDWNTWMRVNENSKFKALRQSIEDSIYPLYSIRVNSSQKPSKFGSGMVHPAHEEWILKHQDMYSKNMKNAENLIRRFEEKEDFYLTRDRLSERTPFDLNRYKMALTASLWDGEDFEI